MERIKESRNGTKKAQKINIYKKKKKTDEDEDKKKKSSDEAVRYFCQE